MSWKFCFYLSSHTWYEIKGENCGFPKFNYTRRGTATSDTRVHNLHTTWAIWMDGKYSTRGSSICLEAFFLRQSSQPRTTHRRSSTESHRHLHSRMRRTPLGCLMQLQPPPPTTNIVRTSSCPSYFEGNRLAFESPSCYFYCVVFTAFGFLHSQNVLSFI